MSEKNMSTKFNPASIEEGRYQWWIDEGFFKPSGDKKAKPYSIALGSCLGYYAAGYDYSAKADAGL